MIELSLGDTISVDGHEYTVINFQAFHDYKGRSLTVYMQDPFLAQGTLETWRTQQANQQSQQKMADLVDAGP